MSSFPSHFRLWVATLLKLHDVRQATLIHEEGFVRLIVSSPLANLSTLGHTTTDSLLQQTGDSTLLIL